MVADNSHIDSKSSKKNKKRKAKKPTVIKTQSGDEVTPLEILDILKEELANAKIEKVWTTTKHYILL